MRPAVARACELWLLITYELPSSLLAPIALHHTTNPQPTTHIAVWGEGLRKMLSLFLDSALYLLTRRRLLRLPVPPL